MSKPSVLSLKITKVTESGIDQTNDLLAVEEPLEIRLGYGEIELREQKSISVTMRTPGHDFELALGFLFTEGIIASAHQIYKIVYCSELNTIENEKNIVRVELKDDVQIDLSKLQRNFYTTSSCGVCGKESIESVKIACPVYPELPEWQVNKSLVVTLPHKLRSHQSIFEHTGGLHACALFNVSGDLVLVREDVGRHNALDKLIGAAIAPEHLSLPLSNYILLLSGRASFELLQKAAMAGIKMVCSVGAPSSLAVQIAKEFNITLIGFLKENRFNIYCYPQRIKNA